MKCVLTERDSLIRKAIKRKIIRTLRLMPIDLLPNGSVVWGKGEMKEVFLPYLGTGRPWNFYWVFPLKDWTAYVDPWEVKCWAYSPDDKLFVFDTFETMIAFFSMV